MKKLTLLVLTMGLTLGAFAQMPLGNKMVQKNNDKINIEKIASLKLNHSNSTNNVVLKSGNGTKAAGATITNDTSFYYAQADAVVLGYTVTPNSDCSHYIVASLPAGLIEQLATANSMPEDSVMLLVHSQYGIGKDTTGVVTRASKVDPGTDYTIYVLAIGSSDMTLVKKNITSYIGGGTGTAHADLTVSDVTTTTAKIKVEINDQTAYYYFVVAPKDTLAARNMLSIDSIQAYCESDPEYYYSAIEGTIGSQTALTTNCEYVAYVLPYNHNKQLGTYTNPVHFTTGQLGLNEVETVSTTIYPNPATNNVMVSSLARINKIEMYNTLGQNVYSNKVNANGVNVNVSNLKQGTYIVKVYTNNSVVTKKLTVK
ncbi:MAG: T9SS type A sorting domain-containing protein [Bacteroidales bacterium]|jgi:hypothetical protein|nr:T9SS type A sorting domain-containing protein [Bacteroidales bacterium]